MAGGVSNNRKYQSRGKQRARDFSGYYNRFRQIDPPWRPEDDYLLIHSTLVTCNLAEVHACVKFTKPYTETEIENRWRLLLFNPAVSQTSREAILSLPEHVKFRLDTKIPFSTNEDALLMKISYNDVFIDNQTKYSTFERLLLDYADVFYSTRVPFHLYAQWNRLRGAHLIRDDALNKNPDPTGGDPWSFSDTEFLIQETTARNIQSGISHLVDASNVSRRKRHATTRDDYQGFQACVTQAVSDHLVKRQHSNSFSSPSAYVTNNAVPHSPAWSELRYDAGALDHSDSSVLGQDEAIVEAQRERFRKRKRLEAKMIRVKEEALRWTALVESKVVNGVVISDHQPIYPTLATLTGKRSRFLIKHKCVTFGRAASKYMPDIDLSCEDEASRISRRHGKITLDNNGVFWLTNFSRHSVQVDNKIVLKDQKCKLVDRSSIFISHLHLRFDVEHEHLAILSGVDNPAQDVSQVTPSIAGSRYQDNGNGDDEAIV